MQAPYISAENSVRRVSPWDWTRREAPIIIFVLDEGVFIAARELAQLLQKSRARFSFFLRSFAATETPGICRVSRSLALCECRRECVMQFPSLVALVCAEIRPYPIEYTDADVIKMSFSLVRKGRKKVYAAYLTWRADKCASVLSTRRFNLHCVCVRGDDLFNRALDSSENEYTQRTVCRKYLVIR